MNGIPAFHRYNCSSTDATIDNITGQVTISHSHPSPKKIEKGKVPIDSDLIKAVDCCFQILVRKQSIKEGMMISVVNEEYEFLVRLKKSIQTQPELSEKVTHVSSQNPIFMANQQLAAQQLTPSTMPQGMQGRMNVEMPSLSLYEQLARKQQWLRQQEQARRFAAPQIDVSSSRAYPSYNRSALEQQRLQQEQARRQIPQTLPASYSFPKGTPDGMDYVGSFLPADNENSRQRDIYPAVTVQSTTITAIIDRFDTSSESQEPGIAIIGNSLKVTHKHPRNTSREAYNNCLKQVANRIRGIESKLIGPLQFADLMLRDYPSLREPALPPSPKLSIPIIPAAPAANTNLRKRPKPIGPSSQATPSKKVQRKNGQASAVDGRRADSIQAEITSSKEIETILSKKITISLDEKDYSISSIKEMFEQEVVEKSQSMQVIGDILVINHSHKMKTGVCKEVADCYDSQIRRIKYLPSDALIDFEAAQLFKLNHVYDERQWREPAEE